MQLNVTREARADLEEILRYVGQGSPRAAAAVLARIDDAIQRLVTGELQGPEAQLLDGRRARSWPGLPYRIYYRRTRNRTTILRGYHGARRPLEG